MSVTFTITNDTAEETLRDLKIISRGLVSTEAAAPASEEAPKPDKPKNNRSTTKPADKPEPKQPDPEPEQSEEDSQEPEGAAEENGEQAPTVVELRAKAQEVGSTPDAKKAIKDLLNKYECKSISDIPEDKRADFMADLDLV